jgi:polysaccharide deacetylase 2 family uncharacterized protein YibQ
MSLRFKLVREPRAIWMVALSVLALLAAGTVWLALGRETPLRYAEVARIDVPLPPGLAPHGPAATDLSIGPKHVESVRPDLALLEDGPFGQLPRIAPDGRRPFLAYARPFDLEDRRPKVAVLLVGLGVQREIVDAVLTLPAPISLQFSPYAPDLPALVARARGAGHEVLLELSMEPAADPASGLGTHTPVDAGGQDDSLARLDWVLARASGYIALAGGGAGFAPGGRAEAVLDVLARRGLAMIELGDRRLAPVAAGAGLPYASARRMLDDNPSVPAIERALAALEAEALAAGSALGVARGHPVSLERLRQWAATLEGKGLVLALASAVLIEQAGLAGELATDPPRAAAKSEG